MEKASSKSVLSGFAYYLAECHLLKKEEALQTLQESQKEKISYITYLIKQKHLNELQVSIATAEYFGLPLFDMNSFTKELIPSEHFNMQVVRKHFALPLFKKGNIIY